MLVVLQQHRPYQADDPGVVGKDADDTGAALDFFIDPLQQVGAPDLFPVVLGEALGQRGGQIVPARRDLRCGFLDEQRPQCGRDHALVSLGNTLQQVASEMNPAAPPHSALQLPSDRLGQARVGIGDHQLDAIEASLLEM